MWAGGRSCIHAMRFISSYNSMLMMLTITSTKGDLLKPTLLDSDIIPPPVPPRQYGSGVTGWIKREPKRIRRARERAVIG